MSLALWLPLVVIEYIAIAWLTYKSNSSSERVWMYLLWAAGCIPLWAIVARSSKDVVRDGIYFDIAFTMVYTVAILLFTKSFYKFGYNQWLGLAFAVACVYFFKRGT